MKAVAPLTLAVVVLVAGCAFQLKGNIDLPPVMQSTYINYAGTDAHLLRTVARALSLSGVRVASNPAEATAFLDILYASGRQRVLLKDFAGRARESELAMAIKFRLRSSEGVTLLNTQAVRRRTTIVLEPTDPLSSSGEIASASESLREDVVWDILQVIAAADIPDDVHALEPEAELPGMNADEPALPEDDWEYE